MAEKVKKIQERSRAEQETVWRAVGRRKEAVARVRMMPGVGGITVNGKDYAQYFPSVLSQKIIESPLTLVDQRKKVDVSIKVEGGGFRGQAEAVRHGITRCLIAMDPELKKTLRGAGFVTRDPRVKERKKPGLKRARRAPQFSKR